MCVFELLFVRAHYHFNSLYGVDNVHFSRRIKIYCSLTNIMYDVWNIGHYILNVPCIGMKVICLICPYMNSIDKNVNGLFGF